MTSTTGTIARLSPSGNPAATGSVGKNR